MYKQSKAESKKQQKFMALVHLVQKGELSPGKVGPKIREAAREMKYKDAKDFASTKHKNLPEKKGSVQMKFFEKQAKKKDKNVPAIVTGVAGGVGAYAGVRGGESFGKEFSKLEMESFKKSETYKNLPDLLQDKAVRAKSKYTANVSKKFKRMGAVAGGILGAGAVANYFLRKKI